MRQIILKTMEINNFKGVKSQKLDFCPYTEIYGDNGTGKSTINEAYMWCIFGKNSQGNVVSITPKDEHNRIIAKVESSVRVIINVDGIDYSIERKQKQKWSTNKNGEDIFGGYNTERYINDIPCGVSEFNNKLSEICKLEDWFMLSSIYAFMGLKQDERRRILINLAGEIDEAELLKNYPELEEIVANSHLPINDIQVQKRISLKKIETDLSEIPARIDECYKLIKEHDFDLIEQNIKEIENNIVVLKKEIDKIQSSGIEVKIEILGTALMSIDKQLQEIQESLEKERKNKEFEVMSKIRKCESDLSIAQSVVKSKEQTLTSISNFRTRKEAKLQELREAWKSENSKEFSAICPTCHRPFDNTTEDYHSLENEFYRNKEKELNYIKDEANSIKSEIDKLIGDANNTEIEINSSKEKIETLVENIKILNNELQSIPSIEHALIAHAERQKLLKQREELVEETKAIKNSPASVEVHKQIEEFEKSLNSQVELLKTYQEQLLQRTINSNTKRRIKELEETSKSLSQDKADCKFILFQIDMYKKDKINIVNNKVSELFEIVKWKMYEPNVSNDGEKEICQAIIDGIPFEEQNTAKKVNASIDIINGLSKALQLNLPMFIDNKESVTTLISSNSQIIALEVKKGQKQITIKTF